MHAVEPGSSEIASALDHGVLKALDVFKQKLFIADQPLVKYS